jgi:hypothetical protein
LTDRTGGGNYTVASAYVWPSSNVNTLVSGVQSLTSLTLGSFSGCYHGTAWTLNWLSLPGPVARYLLGLSP